VFLHRVFARMTPLAGRFRAHTFPVQFPNTGYALALQFGTHQRQSAPWHSLACIPAQIDAFVSLPARRRIALRFPCRIEDLLRAQNSRPVSGYKLKAHFEFRVLRDSGP